MLWLTRLRLRLRSLLRSKALDDELSGELAFHLEQLKRENLADGMSEADADAAAHRAFGATAVLKEQCRDQRRTQWIEQIVQDVRFALRSFAKSPAFTIAALVTLGLGVGANTAFFSTAYAILFRPLPYPESHRLVSLEGGVRGVGPVTSVRDLSRTVEYAGCQPNNELDLQLGGEARKVRASAATWNLLRVLKTPPAIGRWFREDEERPGLNRVVVLSDRIWRDRFAGDAAVLGRRILINEAPFEIVGVMPPAFAFPARDTELWFPVRVDAREIGYMWGGGNLAAVGRLRDGVNMASAATELKPIVDRVRAMFPWRMPDSWGGDARAIPLDEALGRNVKPKLFALACAALLLLLIACANVANLLLARTVQREREMAMREALGAGRARLLRQMLTESSVLALGGGVAGLIAANVILQLLPFLLPADTPRLHELTAADPAISVVAACTALLTIVLFGAAPMIRVWRPIHEPLIGRATTTSRRNSRLSMALIGGELALATALLIGAGLMARTLWQLDRVDAGVRSAGVVAARFSAGPSRCGTVDRCQALLEAVGQSLLGAPGVRSVNWANYAPLGKQMSAVSVDVQDHPRPPGAPAYVLWHTAATPGYFHALGIRLMQGRLFTDADRRDGLPVAVISESTARRFWPNESALGKRIRPMSGEQWRTVVGVVSDVAQYSLTGFPQWIDGVQYVPLSQFLPNRVVQSMQLSMIVESAQPDTTAADLTRSVQERFAGVVVSRVATLDAIRAESVADQRSTTWLLALFSGLGLLLGVAGVHGVVSHRIGQRTREIGIRIALGASATGVIRMVVQETALVALIGLAAGIATAMALSRFLRSLLFGVTTHDAVAFAVCPAVLLCAALAAAAWPAMRAARTDPARTLREE